MLIAESRGGMYNWPNVMLHQDVKSSFNLFISYTNQILQTLPSNPVYWLRCV